MALDEVAVFIDRDKAGEMLGVQTGVTQFSILVHKEQDITGLQKELQSTLPQLEVFRWDEI